MNTKDIHVYPIRSRIRENPQLACVSLVYVPRDRPKSRKRTFAAPEFDDSVTFFQGSLPFFDENMKFFEKNEGVNPGEFLFGMNMQTEDLAFDLEIGELLSEGPVPDVNFLKQVEEENSPKRVCYM